ncbi:MAG: 16S rRNA (uracil(1498)-N(3))-methyltransferase [Phaeodactylibacter sp.]|nr:16S rRNA (uracil(1498)-N(3))-methyltransferase [Phaeodactylibacter sp.]
MNLFYTTDIQDGLLLLPEEEARHCVQVLRHKTGDIIHIVDGQGGLYKAEIVEANKKRCAARQLEAWPEYGRRPFYLHLAIAPTKNIARMEWLVEKATEAGVDEVTPLLCERSERRQLRSDRLEKIVLAAMKQSLKAYLPRLNELTPLPAFLNQQAGRQQANYIAYLGEGQKGHLKDNIRAGESVCILIGPEGDFSEAEVQACREAGFVPVSLGSSRLRTETAGLAACFIANLINE